MRGPTTLKRPLVRRVQIAGCPMVLTVNPNGTAECRRLYGSRRHQADLAALFPAAIAEARGEDSAAAARRACVCHEPDVTFERPQPCRSCGGAVAEPAA